MMSKIVEVFHKTAVLRAAVAAGILVAAFAVVRASAIPDLPVLGWFEVGAGGRLLDVCGVPGRLYFLLRKDTQCEVISTDEIGGAVLRFPLGAIETGKAPKLVRANQSGYFAVAYGDLGAKTVVRVFHPSGSLLNELTLQGMVDAHFLGTQLATVSYQEIRVVLDVAQAPPPIAAGPRLEILEPFASAPIGTDEIAIVGLMSGQFIRASVSSGSVLNVVLRSPEIDHFSTSRTQADEAVILTMAVSADGDLYCEALGSKVQDGIVVAKFGSDGQLKHRFRCRLPRFAVTSEAPFGYLRPQRLISTGRFLYFVDLGGRRVARFGGRDL